MVGKHTQLSGYASKGYDHTELSFLRSETWACPVIEGRTIRAWARPGQFTHVRLRVAPRLL
jgi:hypothetical protein